MKSNKSRCDREYLEVRSNLFYMEFESIMFKEDLSHDIDREEILYFCVDDMVTYDMIVRKDLYFPKGGYRDGGKDYA